MNYAEVKNYPVFLIQYSKYQIPNTEYQIILGYSYLCAKLN